MDADPEPTHYLFDAIRKPDHYSSQRQGGVPSNAVPLLRLVPSGRPRRPFAPARKSRKATGGRDWQDLAVPRRATVRRPRVRLPTLSLPREQLPFEPKNEAGVAILFGMFAEDLRWKIRGAQYAFPDCTIEVGGREVGVELEFRSRSFETHIRNGQWRRARPRCDLIVCWEHNWPGVPEKLTVLELRKVFGIGWSAWLQPMYSDAADRLPRGNVIADGWSVPSRSGPDDILLVYRPGRDREVREVLRVRSPVERIKATWRDGLDWMASVQRLATLEKPLTLDDLTAAGISRFSLQGRPNVTDRWTALRRVIVRRNPAVDKALAGLGPSRR